MGFSPNLLFAEPCAGPGNISAGQNWLQGKAPGGPDSPDSRWMLYGAETSLCMMIMDEFGPQLFLFACWSNYGSASAFTWRGPQLVVGTSFKCVMLLESGAVSAATCQLVPEQSWAWGPRGTIVSAANGHCITPRHVYR